MTRKMNPEVKKLWVEALRSGKYKQGHNQLRDDENQFCCLGVLCNLHAQAHPEIAARQKDPTAYLHEREFLPTQVMEWADMEYDDGTFTNEAGGIMSLAGLNDEGRTFRYLANRIEKYL